MRTPLPVGSKNNKTGSASTAAKSSTAAPGAVSFNPTGGGKAVSRYRPLWMPLAEVIVYIAELITGGDLTAAREEFLSAARERALDVYAKSSLFGQDRTLIPPEDWWSCRYVELPDRMASNFFFRPSKRWYDLEIRRSDVEALWPRPLEPSYGAPALLLPGPKGGERKAASVAWEIAEQILSDEGRWPRRAHGALTALARAIQPSLKERGHSREVDTITKDIRASFRAWQRENPDR